MQLGFVVEDTVSTVLATASIPESPGIVGGVGHVEDQTLVYVQRVVDGDRPPL